MIEINKKQALTINKIEDGIVYVDAGEYGHTLIEEDIENPVIGNSIDIFLYKDGDEDVIATTVMPFAQAGECAHLEVVSNSDFGAFLNWGLPKDLFFPFKEQPRYVQEGKFYTVYIYNDQNGRPVATTRLHKHLQYKPGILKTGQAVELLIASKTELGYKAVINNEQLGLIYHSELSTPLQLGTRTKGWIKKIREDGKIDLNINALDSKTRNELEDNILNILKEKNGRLDLSDKSSPDDIYEVFQVSKSNFKRAIGNLYKQRLISIEDTFIELISKE